MCLYNTSTLYVELRYEFLFEGYFQTRGSKTTIRKSFSYFPKLPPVISGMSERVVDIFGYVQNHSNEPNSDMRFRFLRENVIFYINLRKT